MKKTSILLIIISLAFTSIKAQQKADIQQIRKWYNATKERIAFSKKNKYEGSLYCDLLERNVNDASWRGVGTYHTKTQFWYSEDPNFMLNDDQNPRASLEMIIDNTKSSAHRYYSEYLYHNGKLVFVFHKQNDEEIRLYFKNNKLIKKIGGITEYAPTVEDIKSQAENYMKIFFVSFGV